MRVPAELAARARELATGRGWTPPISLPAATVVLMRDRNGRLEVLLMRRPSSMAFAPGMFVFPGGRVDPEHDSRVPVRRSGTPPTWADAATTQALTAAAVRETFEEAGVLLAVDESGRAPLPDAAWAQDRHDSEHSGRFPEVLERRGLHVAADDLVPIAHWITPEVETRRYDTRFLAAELPGGQVVTAHATETDTAHWLTPPEALGDHAAGRMPMLPPTVAVLADLGAHRTTSEALAWARSRRVRPLMPRPRVDAAGVVTWDIVDGYSGEVLQRVTQPPASEVRGTR